MRKRRMDLGLFQKDVATLISVSEDCVTYWENERSEPQIQHFPKIIEFLGYYPLEKDTETLGARIKTYRYKHGLSHKELGKLLRVHGSTIGSWETNDRIPSKEKLRFLNQFLVALID
jgi:DNA-binding transcriptional regulator YiaG